MDKYVTPDKMYSIEKLNGEWYVCKGEEYLKSEKNAELSFPIGPFAALAHAFSWLKFGRENKYL